MVSDSIIKNYIKYVVSLYFILCRLIHIVNLLLYLLKFVCILGTYSILIFGLLKIFLSIVECSKVQGEN